MADGPWEPGDEDTPSYKIKGFAYKGDDSSTEEEMPPETEEETDEQFVKSLLLPGEKPQGGYNLSRVTALDHSPSGGCDEED